MSYSTLETEVEQVRAQASSVQDRFQRLARGIDADETLSDVGKAEQRADASATTRQQLKELRAKEERLIDAEIDSLRLRIETRAGSSSHDIIAFRDAQDRADRFANADEALPVLERAIRQSDKSLAAAIFRRAIDSNWTSVVRAYTKAFPDLADVVRDLERITAAKQNSMARTMHYGFFGE